MKSACAFVILTLLVAAAPAQPAEPQTQFYELKWTSTQVMTSLLQPLMRGGGALLEQNPELGVLVVRGTPDDHSLVRQLLARFDKPVRDLEFQIFIVEARPEGSGLEDGVPDRVRQVIEEVGALTRYRSFQLIDSPVIRTSVGRPARISGSGPVDYNVNLVTSSIVEDAEPWQIRVADFNIQFEIGRQQSATAGSEGPPPRVTGSRVSSSFTVDDGGLIVLGASRTDRPVSGRGEDVAIVTVIQARTL